MTSFTDRQKLEVVARFKVFISLMISLSARFDRSLMGRAQISGTEEKNRN